MNQKIYEENRRILQTKYPKLLQAIDQNVMEAEEIGIGTADVAGRKVLYAIKDNRQYQLDSLYDSDALMERWFSGLTNISYQSRFVWYGFGNGMYVKKILEKTDDTTEIIVYEPSVSVIAAAMEEFPFCETLGQAQVHLVVPGYTENYEDVLYRYLDYGNKTYLQYGRYINYEKLFCEAQSDYTETLQMVLNSINSTRSVFVRFGEAYFQNTLSNFPYFVTCRTIEQLYYVLPKEAPAIIVSAGPSLDKNITELKRAKNHALIIAVDTSVRALLKADILPDLFISVDGKKMASHFSDSRLREIPMVCCLHGNRDPMGMHTGIKVFFDDENQVIREFFKKKHKEFAGLSTGGSVANDAFSLADTLRFRNIILVGQDLAYTNHKSHSAATIHGEMGADIENKDIIWADGYYGGKIESSQEFLFYRNWFENAIAEKKYLKVYNCTEGGSLIHGAENLPLKEAIDKLCIKANHGKPIDYTDLIKHIPPFFSKEEQQELKQYMHLNVEEIEQIRKKAVEGIDCYRKMKRLIQMGRISDPSLQKLSVQTGNIRDLIENSPCMSLIEYQLQFQTTAVLEKAYEKAESHQEELLQMTSLGEEYLQAVIEAIDSAMPVLRKKLFEDSMEETIRQNQMMGKIQELLGEMQINARKVGKYWDE